MKLEQLGTALVTSASFAALGVVVFGAVIWVVTKITPFRKEIEEEHNTALAIVVGAAFIGIALIVAAAISG